MRSSRLTAAVGIVVVALAVAGCSGSDDAPGHDAADVSFASQMVPHHEQALRMVDMTEGRSLSPGFAQLTEHIAAAQAPEITEMQGWLEDWGQPTASGSMMAGSHLMSGGHMMTGRGMMSEGRLRRLGGSPSRAFEDMWLRMMIAHHQGAIEMARTEIATGEYPPALRLARSIITSQRAEIEQMREMLAR